MVNTELLMKLIKESGLKIGAVCEKSGIERRTLWNRVKKGKSSLFNVQEMEGLARTLHMDDKTFKAVFFAKKCEENEH